MESPGFNKSKSISKRKSSVKIFEALDFYKNFHLKDEEEEFEETNGECLIAFSRLFQNELRLIDRKDSNILNSQYSQSFNKGSSLKTDQAYMRLHSPPVKRTEKRSFDEQLWIMGKVVGEIKGVFSIQNMPILQQLIIGRLCEHGILISAAPILIEEQDSLFSSFFKNDQKNENVT
mmetsp:Transcript_33742/g.32784  ORF Transcript_33742/g.32784 Transcript_33742/m.32784 type:complete len:176 (+) Transcript_33742:981-1508(+)